MFTTTAHSFCAQLEMRPAQKASKQVRVEPRGTSPNVPSIMAQKFKLPKVALPAQVIPVSTRDDVQDFVRRSAAFQQETARVLHNLSPRDRRKLAALAAAGRSGTSVSETFHALRDGDFSAALARASDIQKGLELAKTQRVNLEAPTW